jgi:hypothetical protein
MGNLGRAGYGASLAQMWPYSYDVRSFSAFPSSFPFPPAVLTFLFPSTRTVMRCRYPREPDELDWVAYSSFPLFPPSHLLRASIDSILSSLPPQVETDAGSEYYDNALSYLEGQRLSRCTCSGEECVFFLSHTPPLERHR